MHRLRGVIQNYDWGSPDALSRLTRQPGRGRPEAELWFGAHPSAPSEVLPQGVTLDDLIGADPVAALGADVARNFDGLPFLLKVLAAGQPLSLQAHPSAAEAAAGFAREEAAQIAIDSPKRTFKDPNHKPELVCAITPFRALCGFRDSGTTVQLLESISDPRLEPLIGLLRRDGGAHGRRRALRWILEHHGDSAVELVSTVADDSAVEPGSRWFAERRALSELAARYPADPAVIGAAMLHLVELNPGDALFLGAGNLHAYLNGLGIEILANSDNVVRAGLTSKHVDVDLLLDIVDFNGVAPPLQQPGSADEGFRYETPVPEFSLTRYRLNSNGEGHGTTDLECPGPAIILCVEGQCELSDGETQLRLESGDAVWRPAGAARVTASGNGLLFCAAAGTVTPEG